MLQSRSKIGSSLSRGRHSTKQRPVPIRQILTTLMVVLMLVYVYVAQHLFEKSAPSSSGSTGGTNAASDAAVKQFVADNKAYFPQHEANKQEAVASAPRQYADWKAMALKLAALPPDIVLATLNQQDPFGVRHFEAALLDAESNKGAFLTLPEVRTLFSCPSYDNRITIPDQRRHESEDAFRSSSDAGGTYLFFQHLRKAGGTNFCALAQSNLKRKQVPSYFCMPDMDWSGQKCAGCLHSYSNAKIDKNMQGIGHKIVGNEWDPFEASRFFDLDAIFATSFRKPLDRALSQFRFECIEERGCVIKKVEEWWSKRTDLTNVYVWTFSNRGIRKASIQSTPTAVAARQEALGVALDAVAKFNLVLVMEWLAYATDMVETVLGFHNLESLTKRVRPHIAQAKRDDGQDVNSMGAAGIKKASWDPQTYLSKEQYKVMSEDLALDEILTDAARRMFLERLVCDDVQQQQ